MATGYRGEYCEGGGYVRRHVAARGWVVGGVCGSGLGFGSLLGDDGEDLGHLFFPFLGDVVDRVVDAVWEFLDELIYGDLVECNCLHGGASVA